MIKEKYISVYINPLGLLFRDSENNGRRDLSWTIASGTVAYTGGDLGVRSP